MKNRIRFARLITFSTFVFLVLVPVAPSQGAAPQGAAPEQGSTRFEKIAQVLNLSPQQKSQLQPIVEAEGPKVKAIEEDSNISGREKEEKLHSVHVETDSQVKSILNPTQYKQWEHIRKVGLQKAKSGGAQ